MMRPLMKVLLVAAGLALPVAAAGAAAAGPVADGHRGHEAVERVHHKKAVRRHARRDARRHARHEAREHAHAHARAHARAEYAARYRFAYRYAPYGDRLAYPWVRYWGAYGRPYRAYRYRDRYDDDCDGY